MNTYGYHQELSRYEDLDEDELLASLTTEEIQELEKELSDVDPGDKVPIGLRQRDQKAKTSTGTFSREALLKYWECEAHNLLENKRSPQDCENKEQDEYVTENIRDDSKKHTQKRQTGVSINNELEEEEEEEEEEEREKEYDYSKRGNYLDKYSHIYLSNPYNGQQTLKPEEPAKSSSLDPGLCVQELSHISGNPTDVDKTLEQICANNPSTTEVNLNNIENITQVQLIHFAEALQSNTHVRLFSLANTHADDHVAFAISKMLKENCRITNLNIESNYITGKGILALVKALAHNSTLTELRFHNQRHICGSQVEMEMVKLLKENTTLLKLGYQFDLPGPRMSITGILTRNQDRQRQKRMYEQRQQGAAASPINPWTGTLQKSTITPPYSSPLCSPWSSPRPLEDVVKQNETPSPLPPPPPLPPPLDQSVTEKKSPSRKIAEVIKLHEVSTTKQQLQAQDKPRSRKKVASMETETESFLKGLKNTLRPIEDNKYSRPSTPQHSSHDELMAAIRASSIKSLRRVEVPH